MGKNHVFRLDKDKAVEHDRKDFYEWEREERSLPRQKGNFNRRPVIPRADQERNLVRNWR
jgi:hypothetical protein